MGRGPLKKNNAFLMLGRVPERHGLQLCQGLRRLWSFSSFATWKPFMEYARDGTWDLGHTKHVCYDPSLQCTELPAAESVLSGLAVAVQTGISHPESQR